MAKGSEYCWRLRVQLGFLVFVLFLCAFSKCATGQDSYIRNCKRISTCTGSTSLEDTNPLLPLREVEAYNNMTSMLKIPTPPPVSSLCSGDRTNKGINIRCKCQPDDASDANRTCHVTRISIWNLDLRGVVPASLYNFTYLEDLDLSMNDLQDDIPESLGRLSFLRYLDLSGNQLNGSIPTSLGNLKNLTRLDLSSNLLSGSIPPSFAALNSLSDLRLNLNMLSGPIPEFLGTLTHLYYLGLGDNQFNGTLPSSLANLSSLRTLDVASNILSGPIPLQYAQLTNMSSFYVAGNNMSGRIPNFKQWTQLTQLDLTGNNFEGPLPVEIFKLSGLRSLMISDLKVLNSSSFHFPPSSNLANITYLILRHCSISGEIPPNIGDNMSSLRYLDLSFNDLTGGIPDSMQNLSYFSKISLAGNKLNGIFPDWLTKEEDLLVDLSFNNLLVNETFRAKNLSNMNLFQCCSPNSSINTVNMTSSTQMVEMHCPKGKYKSLFINCGGEEKFLAGHYYADNDTSSFHVSEGQWAYSCSGQFKSEGSSSFIKKAKCGVFDVNAPLYETARLCPVSLTYYGYCLQKGDYIVRLDFTEIVFTEEDDYSSLKNRIFDIYIQDVLQVKDFNIKEKAGGPNKAWSETFTGHVNDSLMKIQLLWAGKGSVRGDLNGPLISAISAVKVGDKKVNVLKIALTVVASSVVAMLLLLFCAWKMGWLENKDLYVKRIELLGGSVTVKQLIDSTRNFSHKMEIGKGGFGTVYRAELLNQIVAVKKLSSQSRQGMEEFNTEDFTLKTLRHENLVQLLGAFSGNNLHLLIYEYVENNSLAQALFEFNSALKLDWKTRYGICLGIAKGLKYLHEDSRVKIVHRDIKASNVLLDKDFKAKISDFGLAKLYDGENQSMVTKVGGTHGYMAPEYAMRGIFTYKADIYSFGVLLLEIVSGKNNAEQIPSQENVFLLDTAYVLHKEGRLIDLVDKRLSEYDREEASRILSLGMICTSQSHTLRPTISQVVSVLKGDMTIEEVNIGRGGAEAGDGYRNMAYRDTSVTDFSNTSTEGTSTSSSTCFFVIKERDEKMHRHDEITPRHNLE